MANQEKGIKMTFIDEKSEYQKCRKCGIIRNLSLAPVCPICLRNRMGIENRRRLLRKGLRFLSDRSQQIIKFRIGIGTGKGKTLEEVGRKFGITRERVRQIEELALTKAQEKTN